MIPAGVEPTGPPTDFDEFTFDAASRLLTATKGRYSNTVALTYDDGGRLASESLTAFGQTYTVSAGQVGSAGQTSSSGYDAAGRRVSQTFPDGTLLEKTFTSRGQLKKTKVSGTVSSKNWPIRFLTPLFPTSTSGSPAGAAPPGAGCPGGGCGSGSGPGSGGPGLRSAGGPDRIPRVGSSAGDTPSGRPGPLPDGLTEGNSLIDNFTFSYIHYSDDYKVNDDTSLFLRRYHRLRNLSEHSSFGPGNFCNFDTAIELYMDSSEHPTRVHLFDPNANYPRFLEPHPNSGLDPNEGFIDATFHEFKKVVIVNDQGQATLGWGPSQFHNIKSAVLQTWSGTTFGFEFVPTQPEVYSSGTSSSSSQNNSNLPNPNPNQNSNPNSNPNSPNTYSNPPNTTPSQPNGSTSSITLSVVASFRPICGRLRQITGRNGRSSLTINYQPATQAEIYADPELIWKIDSVTDRHGATAFFEYHPLQVGGRYVVSQIRFPNGTSIQYQYANGFLSEVNFPDGTQATFAQAFDSVSQTTVVSINDPGTGGTHRRKQVYFSGNETASGERLFGQASNLVRMVCNGDNQVSYLNANQSGPNDMFYKYLVYEGTGTMKALDNSDQRRVNQVSNGWTLNPPAPEGGT